MDPTPGPTPQAKELKVKISARLHVQLQARKILQGTAIHETVTAALDQYFREHPSPTLTLGAFEDSR